MKKVSENILFVLVRDFLTKYLPKQRCFSPNTVKSYKETIYLLFKYIKDEFNIPFASMSFDTLNRKTIVLFLKWLEDTRNNSISTTNQRLMALKSFFKYAAAQEPSCIATHLEIASIPLRRTSVEPVAFLSESALAELFSQPNAHTIRGIRNRFFMILMYDTAARCQELLDMRLRDVDIRSQNSIAYLTEKGSKTRIVPLMGKTVEHYLDYLKRFHPLSTRKPDDLLFYTVIHGERKQMSPDNVADFMKRYGEHAKMICTEMPLKTHPHILRHTRAMHLYRGGMPLVLLQEFLGHSSLQATQIYAYADTAMKREALEKVSSPVFPRATEDAIWMDNEDMILRLYGIK